MRPVCSAAILLVFLTVTVSFRKALSLSGGAPISACANVTQQHSGATPVDCGSPCPFTVSLVAVDGALPTSPNLYRCGAQHTIRIETSGPEFRGFAIQARESTATFSSSAAFVGEFVNPPSGGDWRIWTCDAPSATHTNNADKTSVDLTWQVPGDPNTNDITFWFAITQTFSLIHAQLRGLDLSPDPAFCAPPPPSQVVFGFGQADYSDVESNNVTIEVIKRDANNGDFVVTISPLSYTQFENMGLLLPSELPISQRPPDAAEFELNGLQDFVEDRITVTFPQTTSTAEVVMPITIPLINDDINEGSEGFYLLVTIDVQQSDATDVANAVVLRNGVALVTIRDNDELLFSFSEQSYFVREADGTVDNLIFVEKQDGRTTEQILPVEVSLQVISAQAGLDFQLSTMAPFQLVFATTDSRLPIQFTVIDDDIIELTELFQLGISVPGTNPPTGYNIGDNQTAQVQIKDNEVGLIGFEQTIYTAMESNGYVEICAAIFEPNDILFFDPGVAAGFFIETVDGTALGSGQDYDSLTPPAANTFVFLAGDTMRMCLNITLNNDNLEESNENFTAQFDLTPALGSFMDGFFRYEPNVTEIIIVDDDQGVNLTTTDFTDIVNVTTTDFTPTMPTTTEMVTTMGADPHFNIMLPSGQSLCFTLQGEHGFVFNLVSNRLLQMNALFIPDPVRSEVTWLGSMGLVVKNNHFRKSNVTKLRLVADERMIYVGSKIKLNAESVKKLSFANGKLKITDAVREGEQKIRPEVQIELMDHGLSFVVRFVKGTHLDISWNNVLEQPERSHGILGQFFRPGVEIDETRRLLLLPNMEPVAVMRKPVWHFMERDEPEDQLCWAAMNPGYQGKKLIEGHYLDYLVDNVLSEEFTFKLRKH